MEQIRLNKYLAECGVCSRRDADKLIEQGVVSVNGMPAISGQKVTAEDEVCVKGRRIVGKTEKKVLCYYKPIGIVCTERDEHAEVKLADVIDYPVRVTYAGRLDKDSEGLLVLTNDGDLIDRMMRGANRHEKEYIVKTDRKITDDFLRRMSNGIYLKELDITTRECVVEQIGAYTFKIILTQGVNRQIRRMCAALGYKVTSLKRTRVMNVTLQGLKPGEYREIGGKELRELYRLAGMKQE